MLRLSEASMASQSMDEQQHSTAGPSSRPLSLPEYKRYGRQMILPQLGLDGQVKLKSARVLVVGAGGLGCPAVQYLAAAGVGHITIVDHDVVETSNLARQILHTDERVGMNKAHSAIVAAKIINPHIHLEAVCEAFSAANAVNLIARHDLVLDCTDNVLTRYLISDAAVLCGVQVVSGAAQGLDGQLVVLHRDLMPGASASGLASKRMANSASSSSLPRGPCYRCLYPKAPKPEDVTDCEDGGVLGGITGLVGTMQALETIKLLTGIGQEEEPPNMTLVSPIGYPPFRSIKIRPRRSTTCRSCGLEGEMTEEARISRISEPLDGEDYITFCGLNGPSRGKQGFTSVSVNDLAKALKDGQSVAIDVRPPVEHEIAYLPGTRNIPLRDIDANPAAIYRDIVSSASHGTGGPVYVLCRKGNDSRIACEALNAAGETARGRNDNTAQEILSPGGNAAPIQRAPVTFVNISGGLRSWSEKIDPAFPVY